MSAEINLGADWEQSKRLVAHWYHRWTKEVEANTFKESHREQEIIALRKAIAQWALVAEMPEWVRKIILDADVARNEITKIETGKVKL